MGVVTTDKHFDLTNPTENKTLHYDFCGNYNGHGCAFNGTLVLSDETKESNKHTLTPNHKCI